jgi:hypothetical protein
MNTQPWFYLMITIVLSDLSLAGLNWSLNQEMNIDVLCVAHLHRNTGESEWKAALDRQVKDTWHTWEPTQ